MLKLKSFFYKTRSFLYWVFKRKNYWKIFDGNGMLFEACNTCYWCSPCCNDCCKIMLVHYIDENGNDIPINQVLEVDYSTIHLEEPFTHFGYRCPHPGTSFIEDYQKCKETDQLGYEDFSVKDKKYVCSLCKIKNCKDRMK